MSLLLGDDGHGYELALKLESCNAWRTYLGDSSYSTFVHFLTSPSTWDSFMTSKSQIHLQLKARALLFDKASIPNSSSSSSSLLSVHNLNPNYLQLHDDDLFYSLEDDQQDGFAHQTHSRPSCKANEHPYERVPTVGSRYIEPDNLNTSQGHRHEGFPETWYSQCAEKYRARYHKFLYGERESLKRTSEGMSAYLKLCEIHKRKRQAFKEDQHVGISNSMVDDGSCMHPKKVPEVDNTTEEETSFFPEIMFPMNCVPESALPLTNQMENNQKVEVYGVLDNLPTVISRSTAMMERFGIRPEYIKVGTKYRGKDGAGVDQKHLGQEQASLMIHKVVARLLSNAGFDGGTEVSMEAVSEIFSSHICRLGRILRLLTDSYKKQFSSIDLLKMFLQTAGYSNLGALIEITKEGNKGIISQTPQHPRAVQSQNQNPLVQAQLQRQMHPHPQMNVVHTQNLTFQQQQQLQLRKRQASASRGSVMIMDKDHQPVADVKMENMMESSPFDAAPFSSLNKHQQIQLRQQLQLHQQQQQQQQMAMANHHAAQSSQQQFRIQSAQVPQLQAQNTYSMRTPPVKVEAFHELVGGDSTLKHESELNKLRSPSK